MTGPVNKKLANPSTITKALLSTLREVIKSHSRLQTLPFILSMIDSHDVQTRKINFKVIWFIRFLSKFRIRIRSHAVWSFNLVLRNKKEVVIVNSLYAELVKFYEIIPYYIIEGRYFIFAYFLLSAVNFEYNWHTLYFF